MSLHQNHNVKERQKPTHRPTPFLRGDLCALLLVTVEAFRCGAPRRWSGFYARLHHPSTPFCTFLSFFRNIPKKPQISAAFHHLQGSAHDALMTIPTPNQPESPPNQGENRTPKPIP